MWTRQRTTSEQSAAAPVLRARRRQALLFVAALFGAAPPAAAANSQAAPGGLDAGQPNAPVVTSPPPAAASDLAATDVASAMPTAAPGGATAVHALRVPTFSRVPMHRPLSVLPLSAEATVRSRAERLLRSNDLAAAQALLSGQTSPAAALLQARMSIGTGNQQAARVALATAGTDVALAPYVALEQGRLALIEGRAGEAIAWLAPLLAAPHFFAAQASLPLASALAEADPAKLLGMRGQLAARLPAGSASGQSLLDGLCAEAQRKLGRGQEACDSEVARFVAWPTAKETPATPPLCRPLRAGEWLARIDKLVEANRNQAAEEALASMRAANLPALDAQQSCQLAFCTGVVARKQHRYQAAEAALGEAAARCQDSGLERRALFTQAKVISIQDGLRAIAPIEAFVARYGTHSMVDDVLFWAGDSFQRRGREAEAASYYRRILSLPRADDHCAEAAWRLAWMAYRRGEHAAAKQALQQALHNHCVAEPWTRARAQYWLGRLAEQAHDKAQAQAHYRQAMRIVPLHFYAQQALARALALASKAQRRALAQAVAPPDMHPAPPALCPSTLARSPLLSEVLYLREQGLTDEARLALLELDAKWQPAAPRAPKGSPGGAFAADLASCGPQQASLLLASLLDQVGAHPEAKKRLSRDFARELAAFPAPATLAVWRQAYPLAFRVPLAHAEQESGLPAFLLQALAREESGFDAEVISWAEAVGLTQLLLTSGQQAGRTLSPPLGVPTIETLLEPHVNARLGGALLGLFARQLQGSWPLALAAYNGGFDTAKVWWQRFGGDEFATFAEEMTVRETRLYVQRVLQTYGIYRWLYAGACPQLACAARLPPFEAAHAAKNPPGPPPAKAAAAPPKG